MLAGFDRRDKYEFDPNPKANFHRVQSGDTEGDKTVTYCNKLRLRLSKVKIRKAE